MLDETPADAPDPDSVALGDGDERLDLRIAVRESLGSALGDGRKEGSDPTGERREVAVYCDP